MPVWLLYGFLDMVHCMGCSMLQVMAAGSRKTGIKQKYQ